MKHHLLQWRAALWFALAGLAVHPAAAQDNAVTSAADAFGERVGTEQSGLYSETQVRGFDLNESGAYRIDDAYFSRAAALDDTILAGVGVRVGVNASRLAYPAPTGVVNYRLREAGPVDVLRLSAGLRDFGTTVLQGDGSLRRGAFSFAGGFVWRPHWRLASGGKGWNLAVGVVAGWQIAPGHKLRVFGAVNPRRYDGDYVVVPAEAAVPPSLRPLHQYSPDWAVSKAVNTNLGALYNGKVGDVTVDLSAFHSVFDIDNVDFTIISADGAGRASATTFRTSSRLKVSDSAEARGARQFGAGDLTHLATLSLRGRRTTTGLTSPLTVPLGTFDLRRTDPQSGPDLPWAGARGQDAVKQVTASAGYGAAWRDLVQLRFGIHRTRYDKEVLSVAGVATQRIKSTTHTNASAIVGLAPDTVAFGSWVTGLEESGVAPTAATNRDEVLPPVEAEQFELGVRHVLAPGLTLIGALFDVSKPTQGFRADRSFGAVGEVRHRGVEGSIAGQVDARTAVVLGVVAFQPKVTGPLVDAGAVGARPAGISHLVANANVQRQLGGGWSVDAALNYAGERWADTANTFKTPSVVTLSLGARRRFEIAGLPAEFRVLGLNLTNTRGFFAAPSGQFTPVPPITIRALLTVSFEPEG